MKREVRYRLEIDYLSKDYVDCTLSVSSPIYTKDEGWKEYRKAIKEKCVDDGSKSARVHFWKYDYIGNKLNMLTIAKNF